MSPVLPKEKLVEFCKKWKITELSIFGSALRDDFGVTSDIDFLVRFSDDSAWGLFEHIQMEEELSILLGRKVDLVSKRAIERSKNPIRRDSILKSAKLYYAA